MGRFSPATGQDAEREIALLAELPHRDLAVRWQTLHDAPAPKGISRKLLLLAIAYRIQAGAHGDIDAKTDRYLQAVAVGAPEATPPRIAATPTLKPGMRLMREWNGRTHVVDVIEDGFRWNGQTYASLSAVARTITGAHWSSPRFFGLAS